MFLLCCRCGSAQFLSFSFPRRFLPSIPLLLTRCGCPVVIFNCSHGSDCQAKFAASFCGKLPAKRVGLTIALDLVLFVKL